MEILTEAKIVDRIDVPLNGAVFRGVEAYARRLMPEGYTGKTERFAAFFVDRGLDSVVNAPTWFRNTIEIADPVLQKPILNLKVGRGIPFWEVTGLGKAEDSNTWLIEIRYYAWVEEE